MWCRLCLYVEAVNHHDDVIKWKLFTRYWPFVRGIRRWLMNSPHKGQWHGALMFSLICAWINAWVNNREAGDLRRHRNHYDVIVMKAIILYFHYSFETEMSFLQHLVTGCNRSCAYDNFCGSHRLTFRQNDVISVSVSQSHPSVGRSVFSGFKICYLSQCIFLCRLVPCDIMLHCVELQWVEYNPADTLLNNDVVITSERRHFDIITSKWRRFDVITSLLLHHVFRGNVYVRFTGYHIQTQISIWNTDSDSLSHRLRACLQISSLLPVFFLSLFFYFKYIYTGYNQSVKLFYLGALSKT